MLGKGHRGIAAGVPCVWRVARPPKRAQWVDLSDDLDAILRIHVVGEKECVSQLPFNL